MRNSRRRWRGALVLAVAVLVVLVPARADAQEEPGAPVRVQDRVFGTPETEAIARDAMLRLRSPVTPYHMLDMCPDPAAAALRDTLRVAAAGGMTADALVEDVIARYGERMRAVPKRSGAGLWAWLGPPAALLFGGLFLLWRLRWMRRAESPAAAPAEPLRPALDEQERAELEAALREFETSTEEV